jgi:hypothetical protein
MSGGGFDRIKPPEQRIMQRRAGERLDEATADPAGRAALFSSGTSQAGRSPEGGGSLGVAVHCSRCDTTTSLDAATAVRSALPLFLVLPWRDHPIFALCPACDHRAWLRLTAPVGERSARTSEPGPEGSGG